MLLESGIHAIWWGKQTAKGTILAVPPKRGKIAAGDLAVQRTDGNEPYSDLSKHGDDTDWVDQLLGQGAVGLEGTPSELAHGLWAFTGGEVTAAVAGPPAKTKHSSKPLPGIGHWLSVYVRKGQSNIVRQAFKDCLITQKVIEGSTANKAVRVTDTYVSLDPGINKAADPVAAMPTKIPFLYTDGTGTFTIDGVPFKGQSQFTLTLNDDLQPAFGDDVPPYDFSVGAPSITLGVTCFLDADALAQYLKLVYGTATPAADAAPLRRLPALGSYSFYLKAKDSAGALNGDEFKLTVAGVKWALPELPAFLPAGGPTEIALAGAARKVGASDLWAIDVNNDDATYTV